MERHYNIKYSIRTPFPDSDLYCYVLDTDGEVVYYELRKDAESVSELHENADIIESKWYDY